MMVPTAFDGVLHLDLVDPVTGHPIKIHTAVSTDDQLIYLRLCERTSPLPEDDDAVTARLDPKLAMLLGQALTRLAYRAVDGRTSDGHT